MEKPLTPATQHHSTRETAVKSRNTAHSSSTLTAGDSEDMNSGGRPAGASPAVSSRFTQLLEGLEAPGDSGNPPEPPPWLDRGLFDRGREFYRRYLFCMFLSDLVALLALFSVGRIVRPLIYTQRSHTPAKALRRYVSTISRVITWATGDLWAPDDPAHSNILEVRKVHVAASKTMNEASRVVDVDRTTVDTVRGEGQERELPSSCPFHPYLRQDLAGQEGEGEGGGGGGGVLGGRKGVYFSQWDMMFTQYSFVGMMICHPWRMGAWWVTDAEMEGLIHFWRGCGWLLGVEDRYNFCSGNLQETRALCLEMEHRVIRPSLAMAGRDTEHMGTALVDGLSTLLPWLSYPALLLFLGDTLGLKLREVWRRVGVKHMAQYAFLRSVVHVLFVVPGVVRIFNELLKLVLNAAQGRSRWFRVKSQVNPYPYQT